jgi:7-cyano-7-deazaguanine synthase
MDKALRMCDWHEVKLIRPFLSPRGMSKADIVKLGSDLGVPFAETWSCYKGGAKHCGKCGTCVERREAFQVARVTDPTEYE